MPFRKRPPETHSGPGLETSYGCGESTSTAVFSNKVSSSSSACSVSAELVDCYKYSFVLLTQRESCFWCLFLASSFCSSLLPPAFPFATPSPRQSTIHRTTIAPKEPISLAHYQRLHRARLVARTISKERCIGGRSCADKVQLAAGTCSRYAPILLQCRFQCRQASATNSCSKT